MDERLVLNTVDSYCCICQWWHPQWYDVGHEPMVTLAVFDEIERNMREARAEEPSDARAR
jgi:hypothetical protein